MRCYCQVKAGDDIPFVAEKEISRFELLRMFFDPSYKGRVFARSTIRVEKIFLANGGIPFVELNF